MAQEQVGQVAGRDLSVLRARVTSLIAYSKRMQGLVEAGGVRVERYADGLRCEMQDLLEDILKCANEAGEILRK